MGLDLMPTGERRLAMGSMGIWAVGGGGPLNTHGRSLGASRGLGMGGERSAPRQKPLFQSLGKGPGHEHYLLLLKLQKTGCRPTAVLTRKGNIRRLAGYECIRKRTLRVSYHCSLRSNLPNTVQAFVFPHSPRAPAYRQSPVAAVFSDSLTLTILTKFYIQCSS
jgi:hypothetical protein